MDPDGLECGVSPDDALQVTATPGPAGEPDAASASAAGPELCARLEALEAITPAMEARLSVLESAIADLQADAHKDGIIAKQVERLAELESQVRVSREALTTAMLHYDLLDSLGRSSANAASAARDRGSGMGAVEMEAVRSDFESHLLSLGIQPFGDGGPDDGAGSRIVLARQRAVSVEATDRGDRDYVVVRTVRVGFQDLDGRVVRKQDVVIRRCRETPGI